MKTPNHLAVSIVREASIKRKSNVITRKLAYQAMLRASREKLIININN